MQYANDFFFYKENKKLETGLRDFNKNMELVDGWMNSNSQNISPSKSAFTIFSRHNIPDLDRIKLGSAYYPVKKTIKYLGLIMGSKLRWRPHIDYLVSKCKKSINILRMTSRIS